MMAQCCPIHRVPLVQVPAEPRARCLNCGFMSHHLRFDHCRECGQKMVIEEPEPHWHCPICTEGEAPDAGEPASAGRRLAREG